MAFLVLAVAIATGFFAVPRFVSEMRSPAGGSTTTAAPPTGPVAIGMTGGCTTFRMYAQNRFNPPGSAVRTAPTPNSYPLNGAPWNSDIWFHLAGGGWVSFAGVRAVPTVLDPTGREDGGEPVPTLPDCVGALQ